MEANIRTGIDPEIESYKFVDGQWTTERLSVPREFPFTIYINGTELVTIMCSPIKLNCLVVGYLYSEGIIKDIKEITSMRVCEDDALADVKLNRSEIKLPERRVLTSGCGGGISFNSDAPKMDSDIKLEPGQVFLLMRQLIESSHSYQLSGGIHSSAISDSHKILVLAEDIGRHNTLDKLIGECLLRKIATQGKMLLASGRVSSEMIRKAAIMQTPVIASLTSPTDRAVAIARELGITLIGYARGNHLTVYSHPTRVQ